MGLFFYLLDNFKNVYHKLLLFCLSIIIYSFVYYKFFTKDDFIYDTHLKKPQKAYNKYFEMLYFSVINQSTVGFGDISPKSQMAKVVVMIQILTSFVLLSL